MKQSFLELEQEKVEISDIQNELKNFSFNGDRTAIFSLETPASILPVYINEFWTSKQRAAHSLHEISYRACLKPQLPKFFIERLSKPGDFIYDPFMGRGTALLEAALLGRMPIGCDINPLSTNLLQPRLELPDQDEIRSRLNTLKLEGPSIEQDHELLAFYHPETLRKLLTLRAYLMDRESEGTLDSVDRWIRMVATNRLTGHSAGFFSVYSMPPNQAVSIQSQARINEKRSQIPPLREVKALILKKSRSLLRGLSAEEAAKVRDIGRDARLLTGSCELTPEIPDASVQLVVTSPPFLDIVDYRQDNWLRGWFNGIDTNQLPIWQCRTESKWVSKMNSVLKELERVLKPGGYIAFEVGEVRNAKVLMESLVIEAASDSGLKPICVMINQQNFTKTSNCWGVSNQSKGTNTNRIVLFQKDRFSAQPKV